MTRTATHALVVKPARQVGAYTFAVVTHCTCGAPLTAVSHSRESCAAIIRRKLADHRRQS